MAGLRHDLERLERLDDLVSIVAIEPVDRAVSDESPQSRSGVIRVVRRHGVDMTQAAVEILHREGCLVSRDAKHVAVFGREMIRGEVLAPFVKVASESSSELLYVPHLSSSARLAVGVLWLVGQQVLPRLGLVPKA